MSTEADFTASHKTESGRTRRNWTLLLSRVMHSDWACRGKETRTAQDQIQGRQSSYRRLKGNYGKESFSIMQEISNTYMYNSSMYVLDKTWHAITFQHPRKWKISTYVRSTCNSLTFTTLVSRIVAPEQRFNVIEILIRAPSTLLGIN